MSRHARSRALFRLPRAQRRPRRISRIAAAACGTALAATAGAVLCGLLPLSAPPASAPRSGTAWTSVAGLAAASAATDTGSATAAPVAAASTTTATAVGTAVGRTTGAATRIGAVAASSRESVLSLVNAQRGRHGCGALAGSSALTELAQSYSTEMGTENFFSHTDPAGRSPWDRARALGIGNLGGENIAMGQQTPQAVMEAWMNSAGHRANILDCRYHSLGVGVYYGNNGGPWWTEDFGF